MRHVQLPQPAPALQFLVWPCGYLVIGEELRRWLAVSHAAPSVVLSGSEEDFLLAPPQFAEPVLVRASRLMLVRAWLYWARQIDCLQIIQIGVAGRPFPPR